MSSRVFVVQRPTYRDRKTGDWITKYDLTPAKEFGELVDVLPVGQTFWDAETMVAQADRILNATTHEFDPKEDYILAIGDPIAIAVVAMIAGTYGDVRILKWDRKAQSYQPFTIRI